MISDIIFHTLLQQNIYVEVSKIIRTGQLSKENTCKKIF